MLRNFSTLGTVAKDQETYVSADDPDYVYEEDLTDAISALGVDDYSYDTVTTAYHSEKVKNQCKTNKQCHGRPSPKLEGSMIHGNTKMGLPYILDMWRDTRSRARVSVQVQMLSGNDMYKKVFARVSTNKKEIVITLPMSPYLRRSDFAFDTFLLSASNLSEHDKYCMRVLLKHHPKSAARMVAVSKLNSRCVTEGFFYEQRIPLPRKCQHEFAVCTDGDESFFGKKFIQYPDGSIFLHVELLAEVHDNYIPEERMLDPSVMNAAAAAAAAATTTRMEVDNDSEARVLPDTFEGGRAAATSRSAKRPATDQDRVGGVEVETVDEESVADSFFDPQDMPQQQQGAAAEAKAQAARLAGARALERAEQYNHNQQQQQFQSSLQMAAGAQQET